VCFFPSQLVPPQWSSSHSNKTEAICFNTNPPLKSLSSLYSIEIAGSPANHVKILGVTFDDHLNFDHHISNVRSSSYFHIRALHHIRPYLDSEKTIACVIVGSRLDYANSVFTGFTSRNIQRVQNSLARVVNRSTSNSISALNSLQWLPIRQRIDYKVATFVHCSLHYACSQYLLYLLHAYTQQHVSFARPPSIFSPYIALATRGFRYADPLVWNSLPPHLIITLLSNRN
jgi:hypothetical protein